MEVDINVIKRKGEPLNASDARCVTSTSTTATESTATIDLASDSQKLNRELRNSSSVLENDCINSHNNGSVKCKCK